MSKVPEKETSTAPPSSAVAYPSAAPVITAPPVAGYPLQQIPMQGVPMVQNQPYPAAYPQSYQQQSGQIVISPTSQTTPLMVDANGIALQEVQHSLQQQQRQTHQQQRRRRVSSLSSISTTASEQSASEDCCDVCCYCSSGFNCLCNIIGKMFSAIIVLFVIALFGIFSTMQAGIDFLCVIPRQAYTYYSRFEYA